MIHHNVTLTVAIGLQATLTDIHGIASLQRLNLYYIVDYSLYFCNDSQSWGHLTCAMPVSQRSRVAETDIVSGPDSLYRCADTPQAMLELQAYNE